jgi:hypothetical protein
VATNQGISYEDDAHHIAQKADGAMRAMLCPFLTE